MGDNVGDIAGMGSDLFGSYAESSCAALFVASISSFGTTHDYTAMSYPLIISSMGIVVCLITTIFATDLFEIKNVSEIEPSLKKQLVISTVLMTAGIAMVSFFALPSEFTLFNFGTTKAVKNWYASSQQCPFFCPWPQLMYSSRDFVSFIKLFATAGIFSSVFQLACGQDLLLDTLQSIILAMLTGLLSSSGFNLMLILSSALLHIILILIHFHLDNLIQSSCQCCTCGILCFALANQI